MKKMLSLLCCTLMLTGCAGCGKEADEVPSGSVTSDTPVDPATVESMKATIIMNDGGKIVLNLYPSRAPQSVCNFVSLARQGFYDGLIFHRVISGFMIQGGDPEGTGAGGPGYNIFGEFTNNGFTNNISHIRGTISFARRGNPFTNSAGSQFFIVHEDSTFLDGEYAAFGRVVDGMDVVDEIANVYTDFADKPLDDVVIKTIVIDGPMLPEPEKMTK